jgi:hypothetical protein
VRRSPCQACSHYLSPSATSAKLMKAMNMTSSLSNHEQMRRKPYRRRNSRSNSAVTGWVAQGFGAKRATAAHHRLVREKARMLWLFGHPRQPYESWWCIRLGTCR